MIEGVFTISVLDKERNVPNVVLNGGKGLSSLFRTLHLRNTHIVIFLVCGVHGGGQQWHAFSSHGKWHHRNHFWRGTLGQGKKPSLGIG